MNSCRPGNKGGSSHLWHNRRKLAHVHKGRDAPAEGAVAPQDAFDFDLLVFQQFAFGVMQRQARRDARAGRRAVYLGIGEHTDVPAVVLRNLRRTRQDGAIQEAEVRLEGMDDRNRSVYRTLDRLARLDELSRLFGFDAQPDPFGRKERIKRPAERDIDEDPPVGWHIQSDVAGIHKGWHVQERNALNLARRVEVCGRAYQPAGVSRFTVVRAPAAGSAPVSISAVTSAMMP